ncbi:hypothetical protein EMCRGX_G020510 [Ephydatia muelleri]
MALLQSRTPLYTCYKTSILPAHAVPLSPVFSSEPVTLSPSGLSVLDADSVPLHSPICATLRGVVNVLASACKAGAEKVVHSLRKCIENSWESEDFAVFKVDMSNAFNRGTISSQSGVQQGDPLGPVLFALVLRKLVSSIKADDGCFDLSLNLWYVDDGVLAGLSPNVRCFSKSGNSHFPDTVKSSILPNLEILGSPIGDFIYCSLFFAENLCSDSLKFFDEEMRLCFASCLAVDVPDTQWHQAQLCPKLVLNTPPQQKALSLKLDTHMFQTLVSSASPANKARMLSVSAPHASSWVSAIPSGLQLESNEFQMAIRWWLGLDTSGRSMCPFCPDTALDPLGHHAVTCRHGGDVVTRHNRLRDERPCPADILIAGWDRGKPAALDLTITSPLCSVILGESCYQAGAAALAAETRKLHSNGPKCQELGWSCIPLAVETYGNWGKQAHDTFSRLASFLAIHQSSPKAVVVAEIYGRLNVVLVRSIARAILARELPPS